MQKLVSRTAPRALLVSLQDFNEAIRLGHITQVKQMIAEGVVPNSDSVSLAIKNGWPKSFLQLCYKNGVLPSRSHLYYATKYGHKDIVEYLLRLKVQPEEYHLVTAITMNYKPIIQVLLKRVTPSSHSLHAAVSVENKALVKYLLKLGVEPTYTDLEIAEMLQNKELVVILYSIITNKLAFTN